MESYTRHQTRRESWTIVICSSLVQSVMEENQFNFCFCHFPTFILHLFNFDMSWIVSVFGNDSFWRTGHFFITWWCSEIPPICSKVVHWYHHRTFAILTEFSSSTLKLCISPVVFMKNDWKLVPWPKELSSHLRCLLLKDSIRLFDSLMSCNVQSNIHVFLTWQNIFYAQLEGIFG